MTPPEDGKGEGQQRFQGEIGSESRREVRLYGSRKLYKKEDIQIHGVRGKQGDSNNKK